MRRMIAAGPPAKRPPHIRIGSRRRPRRSRSVLAREARRCCAAWRVAPPRVDVARPRRPTSRQESAGRVYPGCRRRSQRRRSPSPTSTANRRARRFRAASRSSSICGRPGASPACGRCRRWTALQAKLARQADRRGDLAGSRRRQGRSTPFVAKLGLDKVKIYLDPKSEVGQAFEVRGLPTSIVLDAEGRDGRPGRRRGRMGFRRRCWRCSNRS